MTNPTSRAQELYMDAEYAQAASMVLVDGTTLLVRILDFDHIVVRVVSPVRQSADGNEVSRTTLRGDSLEWLAIQVIDAHIRNAQLLTPTESS